MLTFSQLVLCQADAIARLAHLRMLARPSLTPQQHLALEYAPADRSAIQNIIGPYGGNLARVLRWEEEHLSLR